MDTMTFVRALADGLGRSPFVRTWPTSSNWKMLWSPLRRSMSAALSAYREMSYDGGLSTTSIQITAQRRTSAECRCSTVR